MTMGRRRFIQAAGAAVLCANSHATEVLGRKQPLSIILAPSNLGLRPPEAGHEPGTPWAPKTLMAAGLAAALGSNEVVSLEPPPYSFEAQSDTRIRNGQSIRIFSLHLADAVRAVLDKGGFPLVIGGDCSILLGALYGLRRSGGYGLLHVDRHSDSYQLGARDVGRLGTAAGMDLALASGRGDPLLTQWPNVGTQSVCMVSR